MTRGSLRHGHTFLTLTYIRGYEALLFDMVDRHPNLPCLIQMTEDFNQALVRRYLRLGIDWMGYPEDLGMQRGPMLSPSQFREWIKPVYTRLMAPAREAGCVIHMHSDGDVRVLAEDLIDCGVDVLNVQDLVNGIDWIREHLTGRICVDLDVDRQQVTRFGTPAEIDALIRREVEVLGDPAGGLMLHHGLMPGIPLVNVQALMDAMEFYATSFSR
jgi:uroporphyrinogen-III decarboxylase